VCELFEEFSRQNSELKEMKNPLKIQAEDWLKEREIGQTSFIIKRAVIFALLVIPFNLLVQFFLSDKFRAGITIFTAILMSIGFAIIEWSTLEYNYWKNKRK
jgi:hypothetical protein